MTTYVTTKSELTDVVMAQQPEQVYRTTMLCNCRGIYGANRRQAVFVIVGNQVVARYVKCKACAKQQEVKNG